VFSTLANDVERQSRKALVPWSSAAVGPAKVIPRS